MSKKYIGYIRVSNKEHDTSLPAQKEKLQNYAFEKEIDLVEIYTEEKSAFKASKRKQFNKMISHLKKDDISGVIFHKVDRSSRNMKDFSTLESFFDTKDILVIEGEFDTSRAQGRFMFRMFCNMAIWYSENLSEEVSLKMKERLKAGYYPSNPPFGYRKGTKADGDQKKKYPDGNARYVKQMFRLYNGGGYSYRSIAKHFREKGIPMKKSQVEFILCNPFYYGLIRWRHRKKNEVCFYQGNHEPLISFELFEGVRKRRKGRTTHRGIKIHSNPYTRKVQCSCGKYLYWEKPKNGSKQSNFCYLRCHNKSCRFTTIREDVLEGYLVEEMSSYICRVKWLSTFEKAFQKNKPSKEQIKLRLNQLKAEIGQVETKIHRANEGYVNGIFTSNEVSEIKKGLCLKKENLKAEVRELKNIRISSDSITPQKLLELFKNLSASYTTAELDKKIQILEFFYSNVKIKGEKPVFKRTPELSALVSLPKTQNGRLEQTVTEKYLRGIVAPFNG